jgi:hypothetical protein
MLQLKNPTPPGLRSVTNKSKKQEVATWNADEYQASSSQQQ